MSARRKAALLGSGLAVYALLAFQTLRGNSATFDEGAHLPAGYTYLALGDHRLNPEQPPLVKLVAAAPLLLVHPEVRTDDVAWRKARQWEFGRRFLYVWNDGDRLLLLGRLPMVALGMALVAAVFFRTARLAGETAAVLALVLAVFSPDFLAHGTLVTTDLPVALFVFLAVGAFDRLCERPTPGRVLATGLAAGAALAAKFSAVVLVPTLIVLGAVAVAGGGAGRGEGARDRAARGAGRRAGRVVAALGATAALALATVWASYGFRGAISPDPLVRAALRAPLEPPQERAWQRALVVSANSGVLPEDYVRGLLFVMKHSERRPTFLLGRLSEDGFPGYFLVTFLLKTPVPLLLLTALALARTPRLSPRVAAFLWVPVAVYLGLTVSRGLEIGHRHLLPILPFLLVAAGEAGAALARWRRPAGLLVMGGLVAWYGGGTLRNHPHHLAYFNEIAGGPANGWRLLVDSNLDWGQDLKRLKAWMDTHAVSRIKLSYFGSADPAYYGIEGERLPGYSAPHPTHVTREVHPGDVVAVSATNLQGVYLDAEDRELMERFRRETPIGRAGYSILIFRADFEWPPAGTGKEG
jgi:Dolichyl-phosphate-mannose-protein mannosyltransferase